MTCRLLTWVNRFRKRDSGSASIEFVIMFPLFFIIIISSLELGLMTVRYALFERALDVVVRDIRLSTGTAVTHKGIIESICDETSVVPDCRNNLLLEMVNVDPRAWVDIPTTVSCSNRAETVNPVTTFTNGQTNELMVLRACAKFEPMFSSGFSSFLSKDSSGDVPMIVLSAFVQEPS